MDLEKASCRFLADAVQAGKELETFPLRMETLMSVSGLECFIFFYFPCNAAYLAVQIFRFFLSGLI